MAHTTAASKPITKDRIQFNDVVAFIFIMLFLYVGGSKFFELEKFKKTFEFMPIMKPIAWPLAILIPVLEVLTAFALLRKKYRKAAMITSAILMLTFTVFVIFITKYVGTTPCTCGGIIEELSWVRHLRLNVGLLTLSILGIVFPLKDEPWTA